MAENPREYRVLSQFSAPAWHEIAGIVRGAVGTRLAATAGMAKLAALACFLLACTSDSSSSAKLKEELFGIDSVQFTTTTGIAQNPAPDVDVTVTGDAARAILVATLALPAMPDGEYSCPIDWGVTYTLDFTGSDADVTATLDPNGCETVTLSIDSQSRWWVNDAAYWSTLASNLGITESQIFPYSPPGL